MCGFMSLRSPIELNNRRERFELCLADYKMISAPEKCLTTVAHQALRKCRSDGGRDRTLRTKRSAVLRQDRRAKKSALERLENWNEEVPRCKWSCEGGVFIATTHAQLPLKITVIQ